MARFTMVSEPTLAMDVFFPPPPPPAGEPPPPPAPLSLFPQPPQNNEVARTVLAPRRMPQSNRVCLVMVVGLISSFRSGGSGRVAFAQDPFHKIPDVRLEKLVS